MDVARDFFPCLLTGHNVLSERREIEALMRYRGDSLGALISALHRVFEAVDQSPLVPGGPPVAPPWRAVPACATSPSRYDERAAHRAADGRRSAR